MESGVFGEVGTTYNIQTHQPTHERTAVESSTTETRMLIWSPPGTTHIVSAIELKQGALHGGVLIEAFREEMLRRFENFFFPTETVMEQAAWAVSGNLTEVAVVQHQQHLDISVDTDSDRSSEYIRGSVIHTAVPPKGMNAWPQQVWEKIRNRQLSAAAFVGLRRYDEESSDGPEEQVFVTVERDGRQKKFALGTDGVPSVRLVLTEDGHPALSPKKFMQAGDLAAKDFYADLDLGWKSSWTRGATAQGWLAHRWDADADADADAAALAGA
jgi:hypothetical protein